MSGLEQVTKDMGVWEPAIRCPRDLAVCSVMKVQEGAQGALDLGPLHVTF